MNDFVYQNGGGWINLEKMAAFAVLGGAGAYALYRLFLFMFEKDRQAEKFLDNQTIPAIVANLSGLDFETWVSGLFASVGAKSKVVGGQSDGGIDVVAEIGGKKIAVQCKKYYGSKLVGEKTLRELYGVMAGDGYDLAVLVTTSNFTRDAIAWARGKRGLVLVNAALLARVMSDGNILLKMLKL